MHSKPITLVASKPANIITTPLVGTKMSASVVTKEPTDSDSDEDDFQDAVEMDDQVAQLIDAMTPLSVAGSEPDSPSGTGTPTSATSARRRSLSFSSSSRLSKKQIADLRSESTDEMMLQDIAQVEVSLDLFLNSRFKDAEENLIQSYGKSMYMTEGVALLRTLRAIMTFNPDDMSSALESLRYSSEVSSALRKTDKGGLLGMLSGAANMVTGSTNSSYLLGMTRVQKHAELVYAETSCIQSLLTLISNTNLVNFVKEGMQMRASFLVIKSCFQFLEKIEREEGVEGYANHLIDEHFTSGVIMNAGLFALILSFLPAKIIKVFELIGFQGDRDIALDRLSMSAEWPFTPSIFVTSPKSPSKFKKCFPNPPHSLGTSGGLRKPFSELILLSYHIVLASMNPLPDCNLPLARDRLSKCLQHRDQSFIYRALRARMLETEGKPREAEEEYKVVISLQRDYQQLYHACLWDVGLCQMAQLKWTEAADSYTTLFNESKWTRAVYRYLQACTLYARDKTDPRVVEMMKEVPSLVKKIAGVTLPIEKFVSRKSRKFLQQGNRLLFPAYEVLYFFHGLVMMSYETLGKVVEETTGALKALEELKRTCSEGQLPYETYHDDVCLALLIQAVAEREMGFASVKTLSEIKSQVRMGYAFKAALFPTSATPREIETYSSPTDPNESIATPEEITHLTSSITNFKLLIQQTRTIKLDHWMLLYARYELGSLYLRVGEFELAKNEFEAAQNKGIAEGEKTDIQPVKKTSLENMLHVRCHNALLKLRALQETANAMDLERRGSPAKVQASSRFSTYKT
ncbi:hypothetical protein HDU98_010493 [Podochytrium sp. JEL0797]|nr:hypothetical protein HDU98_010493 [Podochytrium sp. JEL0797]